MANPKRVVIVGGGFGGLALAKQLTGARFRVTVVDRENHHLFQPLLYQVATAGLSPGDIAMPIRSVLRRHRNAQVLMAEVVGVDLDAKQLQLESGEHLKYDYLVIAAGTRTNYFGREDWAEHAYGLKTVRDALRIRERVLMAFEAAEREPDEVRRRSLLTFVIIGAGPTGVEMAGAISELARHTMRRDFRHFDPATLRVLLIELADRVLTPFDERLSARAARQLRDLEVEVRTGTRVTNVTADGVVVGGEHIRAAMVLWAAGVEPVPLARALGVELDDERIRVGEDCAVPGRPEVFAIGDIACFLPEAGGSPLPGLAPVAIQQARHVARTLERDLRGTPRRPFRYVDKGMMATIGRSRAVAQAGGLRLSGYLAWLVWLFIHILYLIGFRNRVAVVLNWFWSYWTYKRGARLIAQSHRSPSSELSDVAGSGPIDRDVA